MNGSTEPRRALILAGGGVKVAFQAGVLQVWLDEAGLDFDLADGASGGCLNLAMWCQGMSGAEIAENWRTLNPLEGVDVNGAQLLRLLWAESLFELERWRENVFPAWGLDFERIRAMGRDATFNAYNFTRHELAVIPASEVTEDHLVASVSLPMWFPPVEIGGETYIDAVFNTDANLEEAIRRGADELWVVWTVSMEGAWRDGFVANYFQIIEAAANGRYKQLLDRIEENNRRIEAGDVGEFGRPVGVRELRAEVPLHYLINFSRDRYAEAVNQGVEAARAWCLEEGVALTGERPALPSEIDAPVNALRFTEDMKGFVAMGETDHRRGAEVAEERGRNEFLHCHLTVEVDDVHTFVTHPEHEADISGWVRYQPLGGRLDVRSGRFNLFVDAERPGEKRMLYLLHLVGPEGAEHTLSGHKVVRDDPGFDLWSDTSTLYTRLWEGHVDPEPRAGAGGAVGSSPASSRGPEPVAAGVIRIRLLDFMRQLTTFRVEGATLGERTAALARFGRLFMGKLWDVYARDVLSSGPI